MDRIFNMQFGENGTENAVAVKDMSEINPSTVAILDRMTASSEDIVKMYDEVGELDKKIISLLLDRESVLYKISIKDSETNEQWYDVVAQDAYGIFRDYSRNGMDSDRVKEFISSIRSRIFDDTDEYVRKFNFFGFEIEHFNYVSLRFTDGEECFSILIYFGKKNNEKHIVTDEFVFGGMRMSVPITVRGGFTSKRCSASVYDCEKMKALIRDYANGRSIDYAFDRNDEDDEDDNLSVGFYSGNEFDEKRKNGFFFGNTEFTRCALDILGVREYNYR